MKKFETGQHKKENEGFDEPHETKRRKKYSR